MLYIYRGSSAEEVLNPNSSQNDSSAEETTPMLPTTTEGDIKIELQEITEKIKPVLPVCFIFSV
jgi:hypothetical protein